MVALAVLVGTVDATVWDALSQERLVIQKVVGPLFGAGLVVALVAWVYAGCLLQAFLPREEKWDWLRETAAVMALTGTAVLPPMLVLVAYQMWVLIDVRVAATAVGCDQSADRVGSTADNPHGSCTIRPPPNPCGAGLSGGRRGV